MAKRIDHQNSITKFPKRAPNEYFGARLPFWFSASNYYFLSVAISIAIFFLVWGFLSENGNAIPWISAGIVASLILIIAVFLRGYFLQRLQNRFLFEQNQANLELRNTHRQRAEVNSNKLTIEKNKIILEEIEKKSTAAQVLGKLPEGHLEVFELCEEYLKKNKIEAEKAGIGSPRLPVLRKSRKRIKELHKFHLMAWASLESRFLIQNAKIQTEFESKVAQASKAWNVLDSARKFYPDEPKLFDSQIAVKSFIVTIKIQQLIEQAEKSTYKQEFISAENYYRDALFLIAKENDDFPEKELITEKINSQLLKLSETIKENKK